MPSKPIFMTISLALLATAVAGPSATAQEDEVSKGLIAYQQENYTEAVNSYRLAAEKGQADAQFYLGFMNERGLGVPEDDVEAYAWFTLSVSNGYERARANKGTLREQLTPAQIEEAQRLSSEWGSKGAN